MTPEEKKPGMVGVRLEDELMEKVREQANREHRTLAGMVRVFIIEALAARQGKATRGLRPRQKGERS